MVDARVVELVVVSAISHKSPLHPNGQAQATPDPLLLSSSTAMQLPPLAHAHIGVPVVIVAVVVVVVLLDVIVLEVVTAGAVVADADDIVLDEVEVVTA